MPGTRDREGRPGAARSRAVCVPFTVARLPQAESHPSQPHSPEERPCAGSWACPGCSHSPHVSTTAVRRMRPSPDSRSWGIRCSAASRATPSPASSASSRPTTAASRCAASRSPGARATAARSRPPSRPRTATGLPGPAGGSASRRERRRPAPPCSDSSLYASRRARSGSPRPACPREPVRTPARMTTAARRSAGAPTGEASSETEPRMIRRFRCRSPAI